MESLLHNLKEVKWLCAASAWKALGKLLRLNYLISHKCCCYLLHTVGDERSYNTVQTLAIALDTGTDEWEERTPCRGRGKSCGRSQVASLPPGPVRCRCGSTWWDAWWRVPDTRLCVAPHGLRSVRVQFRSSYGPRSAGPTVRHWDRFRVCVV